jgi:transposase-like protein
MSSSKRSRRHFTTEQKVAILKRHMVDKVPVSDLCNELGLQSSVFYQWQRQALENLAGAFSAPAAEGPSKREKELVAKTKGRGMKWNQARLPELGLADRQHAGVEIHVVAGHPQRLGGAHPGAGEEAQDDMDRRRTESVDRMQSTRLGEHASDLGCRVDVRWPAHMRAAEEPAWRNLGAGGRTRGDTWRTVARPRRVEPSRSEWNATRIWPSVRRSQQ